MPMDAKAPAEDKQVPAVGLERTLLELSAAFGLLSLGASVAIMGALMNLL
jgi:hypothetical protein